MCVDLLRASQAIGALHERGWNDADIRVLVIPRMKRARTEEAYERLRAMLTWMAL